MGTSAKIPWYERLFDAACLFSVVGIYPRFIEPRLLCVARRSIPIATLPLAFDGMKIAFFSDLHVNQYSSPWFLRRLQKRICRFAPDVIIFAGDLLSYAKLPRLDLAAKFFDGLSAPLGVYACLGNHDYSSYSTMDQNGRPVQESQGGHPIIQGLKRLLGLPRTTSSVEAPLPFNESLMAFYADRRIHLLHNEAIHLGTGASQINLIGLGDITAGHLFPSEAYQGCDPRAPVIVFGHNPDAYASLSFFPGDLFLFGHTHGGQVNLPYLWEKLTPTIDKSLKSGLYERDGRTIFITRGVGATFPFRLFAPPQLALLTLRRGGRERSRVPTAPLLEPASSTPSYAAQRASSSENEQEAALS